MAKTIFVLLLSVALCACAVKNTRDIYLTHVFAGTPVIMKIDVRAASMDSISGIVYNSSKKPVVLAISAATGSKELEITVDDGPIHYGTIVKSNYKMPTDYFSMELPPESSQKLYISWRNMPGNGPDTITITPVLESGPIGTPLEIKVDKGVRIIQEAESKKSENYYD